MRVERLPVCWLSYLGRERGRLLGRAGEGVEGVGGRHVEEVRHLVHGGLEPGAGREGRPVQHQQLSHCIPVKGVLQEWLVRGGKRRRVGVSVVLRTDFAGKCWSQPSNWAANLCDMFTCESSNVWFYVRATASPYMPSPTTESLVVNPVRDRTCVCTCMRMRAWASVRVTFLPGLAKGEVAVVSDKL